MKKAVVIQTAFLGDCILTLPLISNLSNEYDVTVVTSPGTVPIFQLSKEARHVISYDKHYSGIWGLIKIVLELRKNAYDVSFLPQRSFRSGLISFLSGIPKRVSFDRGGARFFATDVKKFDWTGHEAERILSLAGSWDTVDFAIDRESFSSLKLPYKKNIEKKLIVISPQSEWPTKKWSKESFEELSGRLSKKYQVVILGADREKWNIEGVVNLTGKTSITDLFRIISEASIMISNDTGLVHISAALDIPSLVIFGPTVKELGFTPYGNKHVFIEKNMECRPCGLHGAKKCHLQHHDCMNKISVDEVENMINSSEYLI